MKIVLKSTTRRPIGKCIAGLCVTFAEEEKRTT
jgi:hypothetical protein